MKTLLLILLLLTPAKAATISLQAPDTAKVGQLVRLDVSESEAESFKWLVFPSTNNFEVLPDGKRAFFSARTPGRYQFIIAASNEDGVDVISHIITILPPPTPPTTDSLTEWIPYWLYDAGFPDDQVKILAANFLSVANQINGDHSPRDIANITATVNRETVDIKLWAPILQKIQKVLRKRAEAGTLNTPEDHIRVWKEISTGFARAVGKGVC